MSPVFRKRRSLCLRGVVLAAGHGMRLRPLTSQLPKPLLPVCGAPVVSRALHAFAAVGCHQVALNLHHQGARIRSALGDRWGELALHYSPEEEIRGTLGALWPLRDWLGEADLVILINGDSLCAWPLDRLLKRHLRDDAAATLLLSRFADVEDFGAGVGVDKRSRVTRLRGRRARGAEDTVASAIFAGAQVFAPSLLDDAQPTEQVQDIVGDLYLPALLRGTTVGALMSGAPWWDLGTSRRYLDGARGWARRRPDASPPYRWLRRLARRTSAVAQGARIAAGVRLSEAVVEAGAVIEKGSRIERSLVLPGARIGRGSRLRESIAAPNVEIPPGSSIEGQMVTTLPSGRDPSGRDSVIGQLVFTPIETPEAAQELGDRA